ncbi:beta-lactamase/transpeptidase-like protein [Choiromyces venosus 120613-1]|uniref:Beta-lactamase/transpeptidase-like protein n=1 Tax=Choiromyces venosus 120613-1 TaxID=1336337 RepID=A0A3N4JVE7_9PEZI|nr:beta-lactamase/transpeptidase-like protein [Choiromyces venosus 120613-1]
MHSHNNFILPVLLQILLLPAATAKCYPPGATFPIPDYSLVPPPNIKLPASADAPWPTNTTSYAVEVTAAEKTIFSAYHTADILGEYLDGEPSNVTGDTYFRIASNTKVFTVLAVMLTEGMSLDDSILKYIPELMDGEGGVEWEDVTLGALGGHFGGIVREYAAFDLFGHGDEGDLLKDPVSHGFPPLPRSAGPPCGITEGDVPCTWKQFTSGFSARRPVYPPQAIATYCNAGFMLLSLSLERHTKTSFEKIVQDKILTPLNLTSTFYKPRDSAGVIPHGRNDWSWNEGIKNAAGGLYASSTDLSKFLRSLLNHGAGLGGVGMTRGRMNGWLKGGSRTGSPWSEYGTPWEVVYSDTLAPDGHVVSVITKGGALKGYFSTIIILPDYGLAANVLVSGAATADRYLRDSIIEQLVPWAHSHALSQATTFTGIYSALPTTGINTTITLTTTPNLPGLGVETFISNGTDMKAFAASYYQDYADILTPGEVDFRLFPTGIGKVWRMSVNFIPHEKKQETVWSRACFTDIDVWAYAGQSVSEFIFHEGEEKAVVVGVGLPAFRISLAKQEGQKEEEEEEVHGELR